jgi:hypothetical protein
MDQLQKRVEVEKGLDDLSYYLDGLFKVPGVGWRFGLDALIGVIPNVGDTLTFLPAMYILFAGVRYGVPKITLLRMAFNLGLDYVVGMIPFIGDAFDFVWKANNQNMNLIRTRAAGHGKGRMSDYLFVLGLIGVLLLILIGSILSSVYIIAWLAWAITNGQI